MTSASASAYASSLAPMEGEKDNGGSKGGRRVPATLPPPPEEVLRCPRCDSPNTKFCYYNNYSLTQPRHFCKACRRYWTNGGALRNVPVGGGSRKNKKPKSSSSSSSLLDGKLNPLSFPPETGLGFKYFPGISPEFQFGAIPVSRLHFARTNIPSTCGDLIGATAVCSEVSAGATTSDVPMVGINYPIGILPENTTNNYTNSHARFASTIESLSSINQDLHWKLQQQRLGMLYGGETITSAGLAFGGTQVGNQSQPISFQMDGSEAIGFGSGDSCIGDGIGSGSGSEWYPHNSRDTSRNMGNYTDVIKRWKDMHEFSSLP